MINLEEYSDNFQQLLKSHQTIRQEYENLKKVSRLQKDTIETLRNSETELKKRCFNKIVDDCEKNLLGEHVQLKDLYEKVKVENQSLERALEELKVEHESERNATEQAHLDEINRIKEQHTKTVMELDATYQKAIRNLEKREKELMDALSAAQNKSATEYDLMQSNLTELLIESNKKLKSLESTNSILRFELQNSKNRNNAKEATHSENTKLDQLRSALKKTENNLNNQLAVTTNNPANTNPSPTALDEYELREFQNDLSETTAKKSSNDNFDKYQTLSVVTSTNVQNFCTTDKKSYQKNKFKTYLPPLVQVKSSFQIAPPLVDAKKRKLYNPKENSFYLE